MFLTEAQLVFMSVIYRSGCPDYVQTVLTLPKIFLVHFSSET